MKYEAVMVKYYEVIDTETGLTVEKYNSAAEADAVADILNRSPDQVSEGEPAQEIQPLADLSGVDYAPAFEGYQPNGHLPETE